MKVTRRRFENFLFYDYTGIETHLKKMAAEGWQIHKIKRFYWEYRRIEPQKLTYTVTYFSEASEFNPYPTENQQTFYEYCKDAGWELVAEWAQMQIFCTAQENLTPIETDESVKLKAIHKAMKKNFLPSIVVIFLLYLIQMFFQLYLIIDNPVSQLSNSATLFPTPIFGLFALLMLIDLIGYIVWYRKSRKAIDMGETHIESSSGYKKVSYFLWLLIGIAIAMTLFSLSSLLIGLLKAIVAMVIIKVAAFITKNILKRAKVSRRVNLTVTIVSIVILSFTLTGAMVWYMFRGLDAGWLDNHRPVETYTTTASDGSTDAWDIYHDPLPLKVEDLQDVDYGHYSYERTAKESFLLAQFAASQISFPDGQNAPCLEYEIVKVKLPLLFDLCLNHYLDKYHFERHISGDSFRQTNDPLWQADKVYQLYYQDEAMNEYILCWGNRIVDIDFDAFPTAEQISVVTAKLSK